MYIVVHKTTDIIYSFITRNFQTIMINETVQINNSCIIEKEFIKHTRVFLN